MKLPTLPLRERGSAICVANDKMLVVRMKDPLTGIERLFPPGGKIEPGESPVMAAVRETLEETGMQLMPVSQEAVTKRYHYTWNGKTHMIITHFILCRLDEDFREPKEVTDADYNLGAFWLPLSEVTENFSFHREIREGILEGLERLAFLPKTR